MGALVRGGGSGWGGQGGCEWRSEAFVKIQKKNFFFNFFFWGGVWVRSGQGWGRVEGGGGQDGWERRIEN